MGKIKSIFYRKIAMLPLPNDIILQGAALLGRLDIINPALILSSDGEAQLARLYESFSIPTTSAPSRLQVLS